MINLTSFIIVVGLVSMFWRVAFKYDLVYKLVGKLKVIFPNWTPGEICFMCVSFWTAWGVFVIYDFEVGFFYNTLRALSATPFIIELTRKEWT